MNNTYIAFLISSMAGLSTLFGSFIIFFNIKEKNRNKFITFCLAFSIAIMIGISISDLIPVSCLYILLNFSLIKGIGLIFIIILLSSFSLFLSKKILKKNENSLYNLGILSMIFLMIHNFPEGIITFGSTIKDFNLGLKISIAIILHNIPEGIAIAVPIYYATNSKKKALKKAFLSGLAEPLGALITYLIFKNYINDLLINITFLFVGILMITLAINEMLPEANKYKLSKYIYIGLTSGILVILINFFLH